METLDKHRSAEVSCSGTFRYPARTTSPTFLFLPILMSNSAGSLSQNPVQSAKIPQPRQKARRPIANCSDTKTRRPDHSPVKAPSSMPVIYEQPAGLSTRPMDFFDVPMTIFAALPVDNSRSAGPKPLKTNMNRRSILGCRIGERIPCPGAGVRLSARAGLKPDPRNSHSPPRCPTYAPLISLRMTAVQLTGRSRSGTVVDGNFGGLTALAHQKLHARGAARPLRGVQPRQ
jgi:hypothetical protein